MFEVTVQTVISAPRNEVWAALSDLSGFGTWNPLIVQVTDRLPTGWASARKEGRTNLRLQGCELMPGDDITIHVALEGGTVPIDVTVSRAEREKQFGWRFVEKSRWLYRGEHVYRLEAADDGTTLLIDHEQFWGLLVPFRRRALAGRIHLSMTLMGGALKQHVESRRQSASSPVN